MPHTTARPRDQRDQLALERTLMANERTFLAYLRTGMALIIAGFSLIQFFRDNAFVWAGGLLVPVGLLVVLVGWRRYRRKEAFLANSDAVTSFRS